MAESSPQYDDHSACFKKAISAIIGDENFLETKAMVEERISSYDADKLKEDLSLYLDKHPQKRSSSSSTR